MSYTQLMNHSPRLAFRWFGIIAGLICMTPSIYAGEWRSATIKSGGGALHRKADMTSEQLGKYPSGTAIKIYTPEQNGFYAIYFNPLFKNARYGYISVDDVEMTGGGGKRPGNYKSKPNTVQLGINYYQFSPSDMQLALGAAKSSSVSSFGFTGAYERSLSNNFVVNFQLANFSISQTTTNPFSASGISMIPSIGYHVMQSQAIRVTLLAGLGASLLTVGNLVTGSTTSISTSGILAYPILLQIRGQYTLSNNFHVYLRIGYQMLSVSQAPYLINPAATVTPVTDLALSTLYGGLGLGLSF